MNALKKTILWPLVAPILATSVQAVAAPMEHTIQLQATVPTSEFSVLPTDPHWIGNIQTLRYNASTKTLDSFSKPFDVKHTSGSVHAQLTGRPLLAGPEDNIALTVKFNGKVLTEDLTEVVTEAQAGAGLTANLEIIPAVAPVNGYKGGLYQGNVNISFDAVMASPSTT